MLINKVKDYKIYSFNCNSIIILSTSAILLLYLLNIFLFDGIKQVWGDSVVDIIPLVKPQIIGYDSDHGRMYITHSGSGTVSVIDTSNQTFLTTIHIGINPQGIAASPLHVDVAGMAYDSNNGRMYVANSYSNTISVINSSTMQVNATIHVGFYPQGVAYDSAHGYLYVANAKSNTVSVIDTATNRVVDIIDVGKFPSGVAYDSDNGRYM